MYSSAAVYHLIAKNLAESITGSVLTDSFSTGKDDLYFHFSNVDDEIFQLHCIFLHGELMFRFHSSIAAMGGKSIRQFKPLIGKRVKEVTNIQNDRLLFIRFESGEILLLKGFGRFGNVVQYNNSDSLPEQVFRQQIVADQSLKLDAFLDKEIRTIVSDQNPVILPDFLKSGDLSELDNYVAELVYRERFETQKANEIREINKQLKHYKRLKKDNEYKFEQIKNRRSYREIGDIIMSNVHTLSKGLSSAFLTDYYTGNQIRIKMDKELSPSENAEKYYRKARNEPQEIQQAEKLIHLSQQRIAELEQRLDKVTAAESFKVLQKPAKKNEAEKILPYREELFQGFQIWIGKNARSNDQMLKLASNNDLWFHAKDVTGSHVILRKKGSQFPDTIIAEAAKYAALNSKAKHQKVVPVYCIEKKYVVKSKKDEPGQVRLLKEKILDVFLSE